jgi:hypothetical protein
MMISPVNSVTQTQPAVNSTPVKQQPAQPAATPQPVATDTVKISSAALAAFQEATETSVQTAKEAGKGDVQAQRLLAREAAAKAAVE